ncbi:23S rRNA (uracil(747)-C(5))-methyltransferase RlmC [Orbus sturtevantii]|uniref:23S rRNA (uracil(747)-C(5))-methyltransferase RlmC n=1 Tax=Orbus sturtevantii TaxID=3074109 RepID=UPI00370D76AC
MICNYYESKKCLSCQWIKKPYNEQINAKQAKLSQQLLPYQPQSILQPIRSAESAFRNKAKMAVLGTVEKPILGIMTNGEPIDLCDCPLYSTSMRFTLYKVRKLIKKLALVPYNIGKKKGELKFIILTQADDQFMLRFVLRSDKEHYKIANSIAYIQQNITQLAVVSVNIQPEHAAIVEGSLEFILTKQRRLAIRLNNVPLFMQKGSFFQTNTEVASLLYATARQWLSPLTISRIWDLFCGVGGFGLHCTNKDTELVGIEINPEAIECAKLSAKLMGYDKIRFASLDASQFAFEKSTLKADVILVNPPRRGLGKTLTNYLQHISPNYIVYSSCNLDSLTADLTYLTHYKILYVQLFDMFPHTDHMEVLVMLQLTT